MRLFKRLRSRKKVKREKGNYVPKRDMKVNFVNEIYSLSLNDRFL